MGLNRLVRGVFLHRFHRFPQIGKRGVLRNLNEAETVILLRKSVRICEICG